MVDVGTAVMTVEMIEASQAGMKAVGAGLAVGLAGIGTGLGEMGIGAAAMGATAENRDMFGLALLFTPAFTTGLNPLPPHLYSHGSALLNTKGLRGRDAYRTLYFLPVVTMPAAISLVWRLMYTGESGILNATLRLVGIQGPAWLSDRWVAQRLAEIGTIIRRLRQVPAFAALRTAR